MLALVRNNRPHTVGLLFFLALILHLQGLTLGVLPNANDGQIVYGFILSLLRLAFGNSAIAYAIFSLLCLAIQAIWLSAIAVQHRLFVSNSYLPAFSFILLSSLGQTMSVFNPLLVVNFFLLAVLSEILALKASNKSTRHLFNIGFFITMAVTIHFSAIFLVLFVVFTVLLLRPFEVKEWFILLLGMLMPLYFLSVLLFCIDKFYLLRMWPQLGVSLPSQVDSPLHFFGLLTGLIIWFALSVFTMQRQLPKAPIYIRRCWISLTFLFFIALLVAFFSKNDVPAVFTICLPALALILSQSFLNQRSERLNTISFYFALCLALFCQFF